MSEPNSTRSRGQGEGARLREAPAPELIQASFRLEIADTPILWRGLGLADLAHISMLLEAGVVPVKPGGRLLALLLELEATPLETIELDLALEDAYSNREAWLRRRDPEAAGWMGAGRPRREPATIAYRIAVRERLLTLAAGLVDLASALVARARENVDTVTPDYTYLQHAQPTSLAHYLLSFAYPVLRDLERLEACFARANRSPAGIGNINGSRLPIDRARLAELLGFDGPIVHTRDAMWQADGPVELMALVVAMLLGVDRLAEDLQIWNTSEFDLVELADRHARVSLIMPQKKNPYSLAFIRGLTGTLMGRMVSMAAVGKTPSAQMDNRIFAIGEVPRALDQTIDAVRLMAGVLRGLEFRTETMRARANEGFAHATDLAEVLMGSCGIDYRTAHRIVGLAIRKALEQGHGDDVPRTVLEAAAREVVGRAVSLPDRELAGLRDPHAIVATRRGLGGAAPEPVQVMIEELDRELDRHRDWHRDTVKRLAHAETHLATLARTHASRA